VNPAEAVLPITLRGESDEAAIAAYVRAHPQGTPFHLPAWLNGVAKGTGQRAHWIVAERGGRIAGVLPLTAVKSLLFGKALVSSGFAVGGGVLADDAAVIDALVRAGWSLAGTLGCPSLELRGGPLPEGEGWTHRLESYAGFVRPIEADDEAQLKAIPRKQRAEVRKALDMGMTVTVGRSAQDRRAHYAVYAESVRNLGKGSRIREKLNAAERAAMARERG